MKKKIIVFAGPSGVGKSTLCHVLLEISEKFKFSISATTRPKRSTEIKDKDYYFLSKEEFQKKISEGAFVEHEEVYQDRYYGTLRSEVDRIINNDQIAVFDIDVLGALNIKRQFADEAYIIMVKPESIKALTERLRNRGTDSEDDLQIRMARFEKELALADQFDTVITNTTGDVESSRLAVLDIVNKYFS